MLCIADPLSGGSVPFCVSDDCAAPLDWLAVACCWLPSRGTARTVPPALAIAPPMKVPRAGDSNAIARTVAYPRRSINDASPGQRPIRGYPAAHSQLARYHYKHVRRKRRAARNSLALIAPLPRPPLAQNLYRHAGAAGNRDHLRSHEVRAHPGGHQIISRGERRTHVCSAGGHRVLCIHVVDRGLQLNVHRSGSSGKADLPANRAAVLRKSCVTGQRKLLARLPRRRCFSVEGQRNIAGKNRIRWNLRIIVRHRWASPEGSASISLYAANVA